ncbi:hypothetical protein AX14_013244 [Amanita brunnescens Koide BX004]|nr:hypothetical protein AX14_013244 [Amanita brunnescens Koide BX004]
MAMVTRPQSCFSISMVEPTEPVRVTRNSSTHIRHLERQIVRAWKTLTQITRRSRRSSHVPKDFVLVTSRRRSIMPPVHYHTRHHNPTNSV